MFQASPLAIAADIRNLTNVGPRIWHDLERTLNEQVVRLAIMVENNYLDDQPFLRSMFITSY